MASPALFRQGPGGRRTGDRDELLVGRAKELLEAVSAGGQVRLEPELHQLLYNNRHL